MMKQNQNFIGNKYTLYYFVAAPAGVLASTLFAMSLQPVIDAGVAGQTRTFLFCSCFAVIFCLVDVCLSYIDGLLKNRIRTYCEGELRSHYFGRLFQKKTLCFF